MDGIRQRAQNEGLTADYETVQGERKNLNYEELKVDVSVPAKESEGLTLDEFLNSARELGRKFTAEMSRSVVKTLDEVTAETGHVIEVKDGELSPEVFLRSMEMCEVDFDESGQPLNSFVCGTEFMEKIKNKLPQWNNDPALKRRFDEMTARKWEDFREREACRRLVD